MVDDANNSADRPLLDGFMFINITMRTHVINQLKQQQKHDEEGEQQH